MDADKIKDFFIFHVEKMILVVVIAASAFMLYKGFGLDNYLDTHDPDRLAKDATEVKASVDENHNDQIIPERVPEFDIIAATERIKDAIPYDHYKLDLPWKQGDGLSVARRRDPALLPPRALMAQGVITTIATRWNTDEYAAAMLDPADELEKVEAPKKREPRRRSRGRMGGGDEEMMMMMMMGGGMEEEDPLESDGDMGMGTMTMSSGMRKLPPEADKGMRPAATEDKRFPKPELAWFIAGTAVIPHKELYEAYEEAFKDADDYKPRRDTPYYYDFEVQRADVTDKSVDQLVDADWTTVWDRYKYTVLGAKKWSGFAPEIVPSDYRDELVTTWIPPVLIDDYTRFSLHPLIPMKSQQELKALATGVDVPVENEDVSDFLKGEKLELAQPGARGNAGYGQQEQSYEEMDGMSMGMGFTAGYGPTGLEKDPVEYKLLRFYDFVGFNNSPEPNRKYVYRVRYAVNDPNFPASPEMQPKVSTLAPETVTRVMDLMAKAEAANERDFKRWTEWSEPCDPVALPANEEYFAGPVEQGSVNMWTVAGKTVPYVRDAPSAKIVTSQLNGTYAVRVPMRIDVTEGSTLSAKAETADVVDPITLDVKKLPDPNLVSPTTIVDIDGGHELSISPGLPAPGMMLLYDRNGELVVTDDIADQEYYRIYSYADERGE